MLRLTHKKGRSKKGKKKVHDSRAIASVPSLAPLGHAWILDADRGAPCGLAAPSGSGRRQAGSVCGCAESRKEGVVPWLKRQMEAGGLGSVMMPAADSDCRAVGEGLARR